ncbi:hypothetical protein [Acaryochloris sp. IP29b_bin.137]|uniref:hypothetical protein n=1 Tax=Acaryochloris sp. IP29b_bin.137 TaxID=2969217 RepID=UPI00260C7335|nr:hypothetical protein [Acaryochloris sp. IP29b_bin.137]
MSPLCALTADSDIGGMKLGDAYQKFVKDQQADIPLSVWLIENPSSPISLPGSVDLRGHDCIHLLLNRGMSLFDEAFVIGYTMGNCANIGNHHISIYKLFSKICFPDAYQFNSFHMRAFDFGFMYGQKVKFQNIHKVNFDQYSDQPIHDLRVHFGINLMEVHCLWKAEQILLNSSPLMAAA